MVVVVGVLPTVVVVVGSLPTVVVVDGVLPTVVVVDGVLPTVVVVDGVLPTVVVVVGVLPTVVVVVGVLPTAAFVLSVLYGTTVYHKVHLVIVSSYHFHGVKYLNNPSHYYPTKSAQITEYSWNTFQKAANLGKSKV